MPMVLCSFRTVEEKNRARVEFLGDCVGFDLLWVFHLGDRQGIQGFCWVRITSRSTGSPGNRDSGELFVSLTIREL